MDRQKVVIEIMRAIIRILKKYEDEGGDCKESRIEIMRAIIRTMKKYDDEGNGCVECRYEYRKEWEYPCIECKKRYTDKYLRRE